jgi:hypothetical protein
MRLRGPAALGLVQALSTGCASDPARVAGAVAPRPVLSLP